MPLKAIHVGIGAVAALAVYLVASSSMASSPTDKETKSSESDKAKTGETIDIGPVKGIQKGLITLGYDVGSSGADDKWGANTSSAVLKFSSDNGGAKAGIVNDAFRVLLAKALRDKGFIVTGDAAGGPVYGEVKSYGYTSETTTKDSVNEKSFVVSDEYATKERLKEGSKDKAEISYSDKNWYDFGITSTGRMETIKNNTRVGEWGTRNRVSAHFNGSVIGNKLGIV